MLTTIILLFTNYTKIGNNKVYSIILIHIHISIFVFILLINQWKHRPSGIGYRLFLVDFFNRELVAKVLSLRTLVMGTHMGNSDGSGWFVYTQPHCVNDRSHATPRHRVSYNSTKLLKMNNYF